MYHTRFVDISDMLCMIVVMFTIFQLRDAIEREVRNGPQVTISTFIYLYKLTPGAMVGGNNELGDARRSRINRTERLGLLI